MKGKLSMGTRTVVSPVNNRFYYQEQERKDYKKNPKGKSNN